MNEAGLWRLFFLTGLPEAYLALKERENQAAGPKTDTAIPAFAPERRDAEIV